MSSDFLPCESIQSDKEMAVKREDCLMAKEPEKAQSSSWRLDHTILAAKHCTSLPHIWPSLTVVCVCVCLFGCVSTKERVVDCSKGEFPNTEAQFGCFGPVHVEGGWKKRSHTAPSYCYFPLGPSLWPPVYTRGRRREDGV